MQINEVIRKYRKQINMTQEEMANRLGVSAPAVNKWESGASMPDISLLAPIARLLHVSLEELLSFKSELTEVEVAGIVAEISGMLDKEPLDTVFQKMVELRGMMLNFPRTNIQELIQPGVLPYGVPEYLCQQRKYDTGSRWHDH